MNQAILLLGCNIGDRVNNLESAVSMLAFNVGNVINQSSVYESEPWGFESDNSFFNQVVMIETESTPENLLQQCQEIESKLGRIRTKLGYESRTMDIDILFYDELIIDTKSLTIPHPAMHNRKFTLAPLCEILPDKIHPILKKPLKKLLIECSDNLWVKKFSD